MSLAAGVAGVAICEADPACAAELRRFEASIVRKAGEIARVVRPGAAAVPMPPEQEPECKPGRWPYVDLADVAVATQEIEYTGSYRKDFAAAYKQAGLDPAKYEKTHTWHHKDYNPKTGRGTAQLVTKENHRASFPHCGGVSDYTRTTGMEYK